MLLARVAGRNANLTGDLPVGLAELKSQFASTPLYFLCSVVLP